ncbi:Insulin-like growth factor-binding protein complex acid labile subunit [Trachymyrmex zeteki]|uniref:Insulin-like growth factor-binding protein complex acid labile subunit n=1 Tax=Mycetomoellerius zeteki TaxID=64791 RepID=A0A151X5C2_9HYME|nr:Insulin-like growth factor-binding protein complex acid labile subunit [Trachymyrmex zeteki]
MEISAAWLLTIFLAVATLTTDALTISPLATEVGSENKTTVESAKTTPRNNFIDYARPFTNVKDILMQEIQTLDKDATDAKIQEEVAKTFKAEAQRDSTNIRKTTSKPIKLNVSNSLLKEEEELKKLEAMPYEDDDEANFDDDDFGEEYEDDDLPVEDDEEVMTQCPDYCKCAGQYAAATTATCTKLVNEQSFGSSIAHLRIENAGEIRLGPNALRARGLQHVESITIVDTRIVELDRTAFNGITYLFAVNLTRNGLQDIHPNTFQNNTQLSLLTIAGNPLKHMHDSKSKHYLLHAPSVTDFDFSNNGILRLKRTAFSKMHSLNFINLRGNRLREIDSTIFDSLDQLMEVDLSDNILDEIPIDLFVDKYVQIVRVAGNNLSTLATISSSKLTMLDASKNKIRVIGKDDLEGVPLLDQLYVKSNNLKRIHQHAFSNLEQLQYLDISDNKLSLLTEHHFKSNPRLQVLLMNDNPGLQVLPVFKTYDLQFNTFSITRFECANCGLDSLKPGTFDEMPALTRLKLAKNRLSALPDGFLDNLSSLRELDLSDNIINALRPNMFRGAINLSKLNLARNPLRTLQVTPFLDLPSLTKLDVSRCNLERVWSEARVPLKSLRFLSVRDNFLRRITVEELRATPHLTGLDLSHNPLDCDTEFTEAVQWLTDHGVAPTEVLETSLNLSFSLSCFYRLISDKYDDIEDIDNFMDINQWTDLAKIICDGIDDGPPARSPPGKSTQKDTLLNIDIVEDSDPLLKHELDNDEKLNIDHGMQHIDEPRLTQDQEYDEDFAVTTQYHTWYNWKPGFKVWLVSGTVLSVLVIFLLVARLACCLANKRGRGPVIRPPMILRQGLVDNKNCGLVYKPLQEEIATPHMPKRGSFYSSSTFHYDKIVPESV